MINYLPQEIKEKIQSEILEYWNIKKIKLLMVEHVLFDGGDYSYADREIDFIPYSEIAKNLDENSKKMFMELCSNSYNSIKGGKNFPLLLNRIKEINEKLNNEYNKSDNDFANKYIFLISICKNGLALKVIKKKGLDLCKDSD